MDSLHSARVNSSDFLLGVSVVRSSPATVVCGPRVYADCSLLVFLCEGVSIARCVMLPVSCVTFPAASRGV
jgi:hypothetical protein